MAKPLWIDKELLRSEAFRSLRGAAMLVYLDFLSKRKMQKANGKAKNRWVIINNGEIEYTYSEAEKRGITRPRFMRAIDELVEKGFIDIAHSGSGGLKGDKSLYAISNRWRDYGTKVYIFKSRQKDNRSGRGWQRYHDKRREKESNVIVLPIEKVA